MADEIQPVKLPAPQIVSIRFRCHCGKVLQLTAAGATMAVTCACGRLWAAEETVGTIHEREWLPAAGHVRRHFRLRVDVRADGVDAASE